MVLIRNSPMKFDLKNLVFALLVIGLICSVSIGNESGYRDYETELEKQAFKDTLHRMEIYGALAKMRISLDKNETKGYNKGMKAQYYDLGYEAFYDGKLLDDTPRMTASQTKAWNRGWRDARQDCQFNQEEEEEENEREPAN